VQTWGFGRNVGFQRKHAQALEQKIRHLHHVSGRTVSLVGWSLGGVFALYGAHQAPECVRQVSRWAARSTSTPRAARPGAGEGAVPHGGPPAWAQRARDAAARQEAARRHLLPVPMSCLYSLSDGVVPPQEATIDGDPALHENIRVPGSHTGLGFNPMVLCIVADRLAQPEGAWAPFKPEKAGNRSSPKTGSSRSQPRAWASGANTSRCSSGCRVYPWTQIINGRGDLKSTESAPSRSRSRFEPAQSSSPAMPWRSGAGR
jgi:pimeloyl-ACP methyl ester carboxylesterase